MVIEFNGELDFLIHDYFWEYSGDYDDDINFTYGSDTEVEASCVAALDGEMWVFGGTYEMRQVWYLHHVSYMHYVT